MIRTKPNDKKYEINLNQPVYVYKNSQRLLERSSRWIG